MQTWTELQKEFEQLAPKLSRARLDTQWGVTGEQWHLTGEATLEVRTRFYLLCQIAGDKLLRLPLSSELESIKQRTDPTIRWFDALKQLSGAFEFAFIATQLAEGGVSSGHINVGSIHRPAEASANLCLKCELLQTKAPESAIAQLLISFGLGGCLQHWKNVDIHLNENPPNLLVATGEAISALEGVARHVASSPYATLGECIDRLRTQAKLSPGIAKSVEGLWAYTNSTPGIRHGASKPIDLSVREANYLIQTSANAIRLLLSSDTT